MLEIMRKKKNSVVMVFIIGMIGIVFIFWGIVPGGNTSNPQIVATVGNMDITLSEYQRIYNARVKDMKNRYQDLYKDDLPEVVKLKDEVIEDLVENALMSVGAKKEKIKTSDDEVINAIMASSYFKQDGKYSKDLYLSLLQLNRMRPEDYEALVKNDIMVAKFREKILKDIEVNDLEVRDEFLKKFTNYKLSYVEFDSDKIARNLKVKNDDLNTFYERNKHDFTEPVRAKAMYGYVKVDAIVKGLKIDEEKLKAYYNENIVSYQEPRKVKASHILITPEKSAVNQTSAKTIARDKAIFVLKEIKSGKSFSSLAKEYSDDPGSAIKGGDLGFFGFGDMVKEFESAAFTLEKGEVSELVETKYGFHIIKVTDIKKERTRPFKEVRKAVIKTVENEQLKVVAEKIIKEVGVAMKNSNTLSEARKNNPHKKVKISMTKMMTRDDKSTVFAEDVFLNDALFSLTKGSVSDLVVYKDTLYVVKAHDKVDEHVPVLAKIKKSVTERYKNKRSKEIAKEKALAFLANAKKENSIKSLAGQDKLRVRTTPMFKADSPQVPGMEALGPDTDLLNALSKDNAIYDGLLTSGFKYFVASFKAKKDPNEDDYDKSKPILKQILIFEKQVEVMDKYLDKLREKVDVVISEEYL